MKSILQVVQNLLKPYIDRKDRATQANIAPVETDATSASKAYSVGAQLILNDVLYDVTEPIAQNDALTVGTNIAAADDITTQIQNHTVTTDAVPTKNSTNPVQSGGVFNSEKATREIIAPVEEDATSASQAYAQGAQLILNGVLYDVTAPIAQNDALTVGTNIAAADDIETQIASVNSALSNTNTALGNEVATRAKLGGHNTLNNNAKTLTVDGITFTVNSDKSVTVNGTATANAYFELNNTWADDTLTGDYIISGGLSDDVFVYVNEYNGSSLVRYYQAKALEVSFTHNKSDYNVISVGIVVNNGTTVNNVTVKPMIRLATDSDTTYQPYSMTNQELTPYVQSISNPNLLDNPWFTVNQRGQSSYTAATFCVDRWIKREATNTLNVGNTGISVSGGTSGVYQRYETTFENVLYDKVATISVLLSDGTIYSATGTLRSTGYNQIRIIETELVFGVHHDNANFYFDLDIKDTTITVRAVKLELGSVSTLALDTAPNYAVELAKCKASTAVRSDTYANQGAINVGTPNRNLLDNPWFTVNQRGFTSNSSQGHSNYTVDRWALIYNPSSRTLSLTSDGITIDENGGSCILWQLFAANKSANIAGKVVTGSVLLSDGTILTGTGIAPVKNGADVYLIDNDTLSLYVQYSDSNSSGYFAVGLYFKSGKTVTIRATKLEIGTISTLKQEIRPEYALELVKCQRYFHKYKTQSYRPSNRFDCVPEMRVDPTQSTITIDGTTYYTNSADL